MNESALRWQCRRGMRELDVLLSAWLERHYAAAEPRHKSAFAAILALPDPQLAGYLLQGRVAGDEAMDRVLAEIRDRTHP